ncbi:copper resistance protein B [Phenylobacterium sp. LH3H17]|uniref:copper resistance protein B n=1 Tax=Phenylobacterium sp. LH3H17 TaxID=2903901 RepID=UPI0020C9F644|nr:copper resistance protein B [Phenylobacterium sp. LH3H17]UTP41062.1 copper resistance protein B [Phenylobacterium sp. LH3H17]
MNRFLLIGLLPLAVAAPASAQHAGHAMPAEAAAPAPDPHAGHAMPPAADPHAGHTMPPEAAPPAADPHAGHVMPPAPDPHAGHDMSRMEPTVGAEPPPPAPSDHAAERFHSPAAMDAARAQLAREHGGEPAWKVMLSTAELRPASGEDSYAWEGEAWFGGDIHRLVVKSQGEGADHLESAELQALYSRAISPYFDLQVGLRHDFEPSPSRTYATLGFEGLAPYWFELEGAAFLSDKGDLSARLEASYDLRLTQKLILEPRAEINLAAQDDRATGVGSGLTDTELGLRLRYEFRREFAPYVGVVHERKYGRTADFARAAGEDADTTRLVVGLRAWF